MQLSQSRLKRNDNYDKIKVIPNEESKKFEAKVYNAQKYHVEGKMLHSSVGYCSPIEYELLKKLIKKTVYFLG